MKSDERTQPAEPTHPPTRIVIFDDARTARAQYAHDLKGHLLAFCEGTYLDDHLTAKLVEFRPQLMIVDLVLGMSRDDGIDLIKRLRRIGELKDVPIVVCSKLINDTSLGEEVRRKVLTLPGVVAALPKSPHYPLAGALLKFASMLD